MRPWPFAWLRWLVLGLALGAGGFAEPGLWILAACFLAAAPVAALPRFVVGERDGVVVIGNRRRQRPIEDLSGIRFNAGKGYPQLTLYFAGDRLGIGLGTFLRWGWRRWALILNAVNPHLPDMEIKDRRTRRYLESVGLLPEIDRTATGALRPRSAERGS